MNCTNFVKVSKNISLDELKKKLAEAKTNNAKPLPYNVVAELRTSASAFNNLAIDITNHTDWYASFAPFSVAGSDGVWNCIQINCETDSRKLLLYTGGQTFPLYASAL